MQRLLQYRCLLIALLAVAVSASAQTITDLPIVSGCDGADQSTTNTDCLEFTECTQSSGTTCAAVNDANVNIQKTRVHDTADGGDDSSRFAVQATIGTAAQSGYYTLAQDINPRPVQLTVGASFNLDTQPASGKTRTILALLETDGDYGCAIAVDNSRNLTLYYAGGTSLGSCPCSAGQTCQGGTCRPSWGTATWLLTKNSCQGNMLLPCTAATQATDCPTGVCSSTTFYWGGVELRQLIASPTSVTCEMYIDGLPAFTGTPKTITGSAPVAGLKNVAFGAVDGPGTPDATITLYVDDIVVDDGSRVGYGYVARKVPTAIGGFNAWATNGGGSCDASHRWLCVNDYNTGPDYTYFNDPSNNSIQTGTVSKIQSYAATGPDLTIPAGTQVTAIDAVVFGNTGSNNGVRQLQSKLLLGPNAVEVANPVQEVVASGANQTAIKMWQRVSTETSPITGTGLGELVNQIGHSVVSGTTMAQTIRVGAMLEYVRVRRPDVAGVQTLKDHNKGTDDGKVVIYAIGDSTLGNTNELACVGGSTPGELCAQVDYCSWDPANRSKPAGGCNGSNAVCQTCLLGRQYFNAGAGLQCTNGAAGDCQLTCNTSTHLCELAGDPTPVGCPNGTNAECDLGDADGIAEASDCDVAATCVPSCPGGGNCPTGLVGWASPMAPNIQADAIISCHQDGNQMGEMYTSRFTGILDGKHASCTAVTGTGVCTCSVNGDCGATGTCSGGLCTGDTAHINCTSSANCNSSGGFFCAFPPPDYIMTLLGYNEMNAYGGGTGKGGFPTNLHYPLCDGISSWVQPTGCPKSGTGQFQQAATPCTADADCSGVSPLSVCGGWCIGGSDSPCAATGNCFFGTCSATTSACGYNACAASGAGGTICLNGTSTLLPDSSPGTCRCTAATEATDCPAGYKCVGETGKGMCRKSCTTDGNCDTTRSMACATFSGAIGNGVKVCQGRCTLPCDAMSCTTDYDCAPAGGSVVSGRWGNLTEARWWGTCNQARGKCTNCGPAPCSGAQITGPCSCTSGGECGTGGTCTNNVCVAGDANKVSCQRQSDCAATRQCLRPDEQSKRYRAHVHLPIKVAKLMQAQVDALPESDGRPVLMFIAPPNMGGLTTGGVNNPDWQCSMSNPVFNFYDRDFIASERDDFLASPWLSQRYVVDPTVYWEANKQQIALHSDQVHFGPIGATAVALANTTKLQALNVCLKPDGTPQYYCQSANGSFGTETTCVTGTVSCAGGGLCVRRPCNGNQATCSDANDTCGPD